MKRCEQPSEDGGACILPSGPHQSHTDGQRWWAESTAALPLTSAPRGQASTTARRMMLDVRDRVRPEDGADARPRRRPWSEDAWLKHAWDVLGDFLAERTEPFTTAEHLWPLLPDPLPDVDRRILVRTVRRAVREGLIREDGARRLRDTYRTADGTEFTIGKLVPIYVPARTLPRG